MWDGGRDREKAGGRKGRERGGGKKLRGTGEDEPPRYKECAAFKKGERKGKGTKRTGNPLLFYYLFTYFSLSLIHLSNTADSRRNPSPRPASPFSVTGAFSPGGSHRARVTNRSSLNLNFPLTSPVVPVLCPQLPPVYQMELPDVSLIPHRISSSPDWRPASLFVPVFQCLGKRASAFSDMHLL
jgi:hypothetical protein